MSPSPLSPAPRLAAGLAALALAALACSDGPLGGPGLEGRAPGLRVQPRLAAPAAGPAGFSVRQVRLALVRLADGAAVLDTVLPLAEGGPSAGTALGVDVALLGRRDLLEVRLAAADAGGDTIFRAVDTVAVTRGGAEPVREILLRYAGADTAIARIAAGPGDTTVAPGAAVTVWAVGYEAGAQAPRPLAHVAWHSSDETVARVSRTGGFVETVAPGEVWIHARTATGLADSAHVRVALPASVPARVTLDPASLALTVGGTARPAAAVLDAAGAPLAAAVAWSSSAPAVATVDADGTVRAVAPGSATVTAASGPASAALPVLVQAPPPPPVAAVTVAPATVALVAGQGGALAATAVTADGAPVADRPVVWHSSDEAVVTVGDGALVARGVGTATVTATVGGATGSATVTVAPPPPNVVLVSPAGPTLVAGGTLALAATVTDAAGAPVAGAAVTWRSADAAVATVSAAGVVTAVAPGATTVTARADGRESATTVTVIAPPVAAVTLSAATVALAPGETRALVATPRAAGGAALDGHTVAWTTTNAAVATVSASGVVAAVAPGSATVRATVQGRSAAAEVTVSPAPVATVTVETASATLAPGQTHQLHARLRDAAGLLLTGRPVAWRTSDPAVATVRSDGLVTAVAAGTATITAESEGRSGTATVTVTGGRGALDVVGWPWGGSFTRDREYRLRIYPTDAGGARRATFGAPVVLRFVQEGKLEVHRDKYPLLLAGPTSGSKDGRLESNDLLNVPAGSAYVSIIVVIKGDEAMGALTVAETTGAYAPHARLRGETDDD